MNYKSDTCLCIVEFNVINGDPIYSNWIQKCQLHKMFSDQQLIDEIRTLNKKYQAPENPTKDQIKKNFEERKAEYDKIKAMGDPVIH